MLVTVNRTSAPVPPGATEPRLGPPVMVSVRGDIGVPVSATVATEAPGPLSVMVNFAVAAAVAVTGE